MIDRKAFLNLLASGAYLSQAKSIFARNEKNSIASIGVQAPGLMPYRGQSNSASVLKVLKIGMQPAPEKQVTLGISGGHSLLETSQGLFVAGNREQSLLLSSDLKVKKAFSAPRGFEFGGHALNYSKQQVLCTLRPSRLNKTRQHGFLALLDLKKDAPEIITSTGGYDPHDMIRLRDGRILVCNYGNKTIAELSSYSGLEPSLSFFSPSLERLLVVAAPKIGSISHTCEAWPNQIALLPAKLKSLSQQSIEEVGLASGAKPISVSFAEIAEGKTGFPSPVLLYNIENEQWTSIIPDPARQRRPQSLAYHMASRKLWVTFSFSQTVACISEDMTSTYLSAFDMGLSTPRGICFGADGLVYINGQLRTIAVIDPFSLKVVRRINTENFDATHIFSIFS